MQSIGPHAVTNAGFLRWVCVDAFEATSNTPSLGESFMVSMSMSYPMSSLSIFHSKKGRLVEDLSRLLNDIRYGSFIIVGLPGKLPKASDYFLFSKEKIKELSLLKWSEIRKLGDRQDSYGRLF